VQNRIYLPPPKVLAKWARKCYPELKPPQREELINKLKEYTEATVKEDITMGDIFENGNYIRAFPFVMCNGVSWDPVEYETFVMNAEENVTTSTVK
jgi:hypothetical protein